MPRECSICVHPARENIDSALVRRTPYRDISIRYNVSKDALSRHLNGHLADYVQQALSEYGTGKGIKVLDRLTRTLERLDAFLDEAEKMKDAREFVMVAAEIRKELELVAKLQGELAQEGTTNILVHPEYLEIRTAILVALESHPEAAESVSRAMLELDRGDGHR